MSTFDSISKKKEKIDDVKKHVKIPTNRMNLNIQSNDDNA